VPRDQVYRHSVVAAAWNNHVGLVDAGANVLVERGLDKRVVLLDDTCEIATSLCDIAAY